MKLTFKKILAQTIAAISITTAMSFTAHAQVAVKDAWVRATVGPQKVTGAFLQITATQDAKLVAAQSDAAKKVELHTMEMDKDVMRMREIASLDLPAGKTVELKPGSYHIMLIDLNKPVKEGDTVAITLVIENKDKKRENIEVKATAKSLTSSSHKM
ncbi:copper chaperone PCu(A)C [Undibacterium cyanobacteriorum]|uniref:Copper chaperone PCu(A)C n=1 Tax=Undibacterium cyanobacteriorum TaxID=3073561 RepID=A0ABY9RL05_9BURK|nr:copper chaperone PCu(A)C [Undibacterium sp. 20NA77.5]WMW81905.1 copper chaperone PCu(A)C [Undibacterium sp. 20NA77.5]